MDINKPFITIGERISLYFSSHKLMLLPAGIVIYTLMFALFGYFLYIPTISQGEPLLIGDGMSQYYPMLMNFRRNELEFSENLSNGNFSLTMLDLNYLFGSDALTMSSLPFIPLLPVFLLVGLVPEASVGMFLSAVDILVSYAAGISFILLCRHFKQNVVWGGFFAVFYVFCGAYLSNLMYNFFFIYMMIAFPLMIIGMDRIICGKNGILLSQSVAFMALAGVNMPVYTLPFVVVFAIIRVYFLKKEHYFLNLLRYFLIGLGYAVLGVLTAAVTLLPAICSVMESAREVNIGNILELLVPSLDRTENIYYFLSVDNMLAICFAVAPFVIFALVSKKTPLEIKWYYVAMIIITALPIFVYALNGFQYDLYRWGFVAPILMCFSAVYCVGKIHLAEKSEAVLFSVMLAAFALTYVQQLWRVGFVALCVISLIVMIKPVREFLSKLFSVLTEKLKCLFGSPVNGKKAGILPLLILCIVALAVVLFGVYAATSMMRYNYPLALIILCAAIILLVILSRRRIIGKELFNLVLIICVVGVGFSVYSKIGFGKVSDSEEAQNTIYAAAAELEQKENCFSRIANTYFFDSISGSVSTDVLDNAETDENAQSSSLGDGFLSATQNFAYKYGLPSSDCFNSTIDKDFINLLKKCESDCATLYSTGVVHGFGLSEALYSLFGVEYLMSDGICDGYPTAYGFDALKSVTSGEYAVDIKKNNYALPIGVTYDTVMDKETFDSLSPAALPYAMMNGVYPEDCDTNLGKTDTSVFGEACDFDLRQESRGEIIGGITCYDNYVTINSNVSDCFVYLRLKGVNSYSSSTVYTEGFNVEIDGNSYFHGLVMNNNTAWKWKLPRDNYTFELGYSENGIKELYFVSPFEFDEIELYAVPASCFTQAYADRCEETLENAKISTNTIEGDITVSSQKILSINVLHNKGWTAYVDGEKTPIYKINGVFVGLVLDEGSHTVRLEYRTPFLYEGAFVSLVAVAVLIVVGIVTRRKTKRKK